MSTIFIWGTGKAGARLFKKLKRAGISISGFICSDAYPKATNFGCPIYFPSEARALAVKHRPLVPIDSDSLGVILLASQFRKEIEDEFNLAGLSDYFRLLSPEDFLSNFDYRKWRSLFGQEFRRRFLRRLKFQAFVPKLSVIIPIFQPRLSELLSCLASVTNQTLPAFEVLCVFDGDCKEHAFALEALKRSDQSAYLSFFIARRGGISSTINEGIRRSKGDYCCIVDQDDLIEPDCFESFSRVISNHPAVEVVYCDEDKIDDKEDLFSPFFKPSFDPVLLVQQNFICHMLCIRRSIFDHVGLFKPSFDGVQDHEWLLRFTRSRNQASVLHIPLVLYHWRVSSSSTASDISNKPQVTRLLPKVVNRHLKDIGATFFRSRIEPTSRIYGSFRFSFPKRKQPKISIIIPTRNCVGVLRKCIESIQSCNSYSNFEIIVIDNNSNDSGTLQYLLSLSNKGKIRCARDELDFNFSRLINLGASLASGDYLLLLNNDVEFIPGGEDALHQMVGLSLAFRLSAVGTKLLYPDGNTIQHAGVVLGIGGVAGHRHKYFDDSEDGNFGSLHLDHMVSAVTGACMLIRKDHFFDVSGFDEGIAVAFNDIDFCLRLGAAGYKVGQCSSVKLLHWESKSRGLDTLSPAKIRRFKKERGFMIKRWGNSLLTDEFYNPNLTLDHENFSLSWAPRI